MNSVRYASGQQRPLSGSAANRRVVGVCLSSGEVEIVAPDERGGIVRQTSLKIIRDGTIENGQRDEAGSRCSNSSFFVPQASMEFAWRA